MSPARPTFATLFDALNRLSEQVGEVSASQVAIKDVLEHHITQEGDSLERVAGAITERLQALDGRIDQIEQALAFARGGWKAALGIGGAVATVIGAAAWIADALHISINWPGRG